MPISDCEVRDPRMKRTRQLLQGALRGLLCEKHLDEIGVQDIAEAATVNRATFYDHYTDKSALFEAMVAGDFHRLLEQRNIQFNGSCSSGLSALILAVTDYLQRTRSDRAACPRQSSVNPLMDQAITLAIRRVLLEGLSKHAGELSATPEVVASAASGAIYGAVKEWFSSSNGPPDEATVVSLVQLIHPLLQAGAVSSPTSRKRAAANR